MTNKELVEKLYKAVDAKNLAGLSLYLSENVHFRIANHDAVIGKEAVLDANKAFFCSINSMSHNIDNVWTENKIVICNGFANYVRLDSSKLSVAFATILTIGDSKIIDYLVYVDISEL